MHAHAQLSIRRPRESVLARVHYNIEHRLFVDARANCATRAAATSIYDKVLLLREALNDDDKYKPLSGGGDAGTGQLVGRRRDVKMGSREGLCMGS